MGGPCDDPQTVENDLRISACAERGSTRTNKLYPICFKNVVDIPVGAYPILMLERSQSIGKMAGLC